MKITCMYCKHKGLKTDSYEHKKGMFIHIKCIEHIDKEIFSEFVSLNKEIETEHGMIALMDLLPAKLPNTDKRLGLDLKLLVDTLGRKGKTQEALALQYFIDGLNQSQMVRKFRRGRKRVSQIVISLRKELAKLGIGELGYIR